MVPQRSILPLQCPLIIYYGHIYAARVDREKIRRQRPTPCCQCSLSGCRRSAAEWNYRRSQPRASSRIACAELGVALDESTCSAYDYSCRNAPDKTGVQRLQHSYSPFVVTFCSGEVCTAGDMRIMVSTVS